MVERIDEGGNRRPAQPHEVAMYDQLGAHFSVLTSEFVALRTTIKQAALVNDTKLIASATKKMNEMIQKEWPNCTGPQVNYILFLIHLVEQASAWTSRNFEALNAVLRIVGALQAPEHVVFTLPGFSRDDLDEDVEKILDCLLDEEVEQEQDRQSFLDDSYRIGEKFTTGTGVALGNVHLPEQCSGQFCVVHHPVPGPWDKWDTHWKQSWKLMVRVCPHGVEHVAMEEMLRTPLLGMINHDHPAGCDCPCDLSRVTPITDKQGKVVGFQAT